jgi:hypothetical protein
MRKVVGAIVGAVVGLLAAMLVIRIGAMLFPVRPDPTIQDRVVQLQTAFAQAPLQAQLFIAGAFFVGGLVAALVAKAISGLAWPAWVAVALVVLFALLVVLVLPLPATIQAATVLLPLIGGLIGNHLVRRRRGDAGRPAPADA